MRIAAFLSTAFGAFLVAIACFEYWIGDLECAASTSVLSGFFIGCGVLLFVVRRQLRARLAAPLGHDAVGVGNRLRHETAPNVPPSAPRVPSSELSDFEALGRRPDVRKLIEDLWNPAPERQK